MAIEPSVTSQELWTSSVVAAALDAPCDGNDAWCDCVAASIASGNGTTAALCVRDAQERVVGTGASACADDSARDTVLKQVVDASGSEQGGDSVTRAEYSSPTVRGELSLLIVGGSHGAGEHGALVTTLLAQIYRVRLAEPQARRAGILERVRPSQREILPLLTTGMSQRDISRVLGKSPHTIHDHTKMIYRTLEVHNRVELASVWHGFPLERPGAV